MIRHEKRFYLPVRVYFEDTDAGGILYHASHVRFFERGRTELLRAKGIAQSAALAHHDQKRMFTVQHLDIRYWAPAFLDDLLTVETWVAEARGAGVILHQMLWREKGESGKLIASVHVRVALVNKEGKPRRLPKELAAALDPAAE